MNKIIARWAILKQHYILNSFRTLSTNSGRDVYARGRRYFLIVAFWNLAQENTCVCVCGRAKSNLSRDSRTSCLLNYVKIRAIYGFLQDNSRESSRPRMITNSQISMGWYSPLANVISLVYHASLSMLLRPTVWRAVRKAGRWQTRNISRASTFLTEPPPFGQWSPSSCRSQCSLYAFISCVPWI